MSSKKQFIKELRPKDQVEDVFLVKHLGVMESKDGKKYLNVVFTDNSGDIEGRVWSKAEDIAKRVQKGVFAQVKGKVNSFQGRRQIIATTIEGVSEADVNMDDFLAKSQFNPEEMFNELKEIVSSLDDYYIKELLTSILSDKEISRRMKLWQAGKTIHHAYQSGLLEHILSCTKLAVTLSAHYKVNRNFVVAGAVLHDLCKIYELTSGVQVEYTEEGKLVGHLVKIIELIDRFSYKIKNFPYNTKLHLKHIMLSHHGHYEFGSPQVPLTKEAYLVHMIDLMDSKMGSLETVIKNDTAIGHWSGYVRHLDRMVFKAELPHYDSEISDDEVAKARSLSFSPNGNTGKTSKSKRRNHDPELKQNLGDLFGDIKIETKE